MTETATPITETPEFKQAVADAITAALPAIVAQLSKAKGDVPVSAGEQSWAEGLAMAISQLTDQGTGRKRVAPEVIKQRDEARQKMVGLLVEAKASGQMPEYELRNKVYLEEVLIDPIYMDPATKTPRPTVIGWPSVPSNAMKPVNDIAIAIYEQFSLSVGSVDRIGAVDTFGISVGGLVVKNGAVQPKRAVPSEDGHIKTESLVINGRGGAQKFKEIPVLGTIAAPARQVV